MDTFCSALCVEYKSTEELIDLVVFGVCSPTIANKFGENFSMGQYRTASVDRDFQNLGGAVWISIVSGKEVGGKDKDEFETGQGASQRRVEK